jgi:micrococcal nuclease
MKIRPMRTACRILSIPVVFLLLLPTVSTAGQFKVIKVYDGNIIKAKGSDIEIKVRLAGIDTPETPRKSRPGQPYGYEAKNQLARLILDKEVEIKGYGLDRLNRILGVIYLEGKNINLEMVRAGLAEVYRGGRPRGLDLDPYWLAEKEAREALRGVWSLGDEYISPKKWRKMHRKR